jgi:hypothetical protein
MSELVNASVGAEHDRQPDQPLEAHEPAFHRAFAVDHGNIGGEPGLEEVDVRDRLVRLQEHQALRQIDRIEVRAQPMEVFGRERAQKQIVERSGWRAHGVWSTGRSSRGVGTSDKCEHLHSTSSLGRADQDEERDYESYRREVGKNVAGAEGHQPGHACQQREKATPQHHGKRLEGTAVNERFPGPVPKAALMPRNYGLCGPG